MAPHLTRPALGLATLPPVLEMTSFFAVRYSLVPPGSNNAAQLAALTYAANHCVDLLQLLPSQSRPPVFLFADNLYAINTGTGRWSAKANLDAVATLKSSILTLRALTTVAVHWVPDHSLIYGNEIADLLAGTTCSSMPDVPTLIDLRLQCNLPPLV
jgi:ribonuclease HI